MAEYNFTLKINETGLIYIIAAIIEKWSNVVFILKDSYLPAIKKGKP